MRIFSLPLALAICGATMYTACLFPEIAYLDEDDASTAGGGGVGTPTVGGMGGAAGMVATTAGGNGGGGQPPLNCEVANLGLTGLCAAPNKCTVTDAATGAVGCALAGSTDNWETCTDDTDCKDGSWCDLLGGVCKPFCRNGIDCVANTCVRAKLTPTEDIPNNVKTCISMCNPLDATPCGGNSVTCTFIGSNQFDCAASMNFTRLQTCNVQSDCGATLACITDIFNDKACELYCSPIGQSYPGCSLVNCSSIDQPEVEWMGTPIGTCY